MSAIDRAATAMAVAVGVQARREALRSMMAACLDELSRHAADGSAVTSCREKHDAMVSVVRRVVDDWQERCGILVDRVRL